MRKTIFGSFLTFALLAGLFNLVSLVSARSQDLGPNRLRPPLRLIDGSGQNLGFLVDYIRGGPGSVNPSSFLLPQNVILRFDQNNDLRIVNWAGGPTNLYFTSTDCSGVAYTTDHNGYPHEILRGWSGQIYRFTKAPEVIIPLHSKLEDTGCTVEHHNDFSVNELEPISLPINTNFTWPLSIL